MCFQCPGPDHTWRCARDLGKVIAGRGLVVSLAGPLGAGKTVFVKGLADGLGIDPATVSSPSFVILNEYRVAGRRRLVHADLYRVASGQELEDAGFLDLLEPGVVVAVEWGDRFPEVLPEDRLDLRIARTARAASGGTSTPPGEPRRIEVRAGGRQAAAALRDWRVELRSSCLGR